MKKLLLDTNIILDLLAKREPFYKEAALLFSLADQEKVQVFVSALSYANANYVLLRENKPEDAKLKLRKLRLIVQILNLDEKVVDLSLNDENFRDFEDALQYYTALENGIEIIITRNLRDFQKSALPVMTAGQFIARGI
ncbi:MAG: PIN domain-containing protein [Saprospiraceae bacterium]|jgi:predicted nucleic acid-binding protein|nr:PIN domain-containing protein [Saprospiraceae bacterium]